MKRDHEIIIFENQSVSLKDPATGEAMHSSIGPWAEANLIYVEQSDLSNRVSSFSAQPLVIFDVGMGIAANSIAALERYFKLRREGSARRGLAIVSFENDLGGLETALANLDRFPYLAAWEGALRTLLETGAWHSSEENHISWSLRSGDFRTACLSGSPELVYYDFFSPKSAPELWTAEQFERLFKACSGSRPVTLITYTASTMVRSGLLLSGFYVGDGVSTSAKRQTTIASSDPSFVKAPLTKKWLRKVSHSEALLKSLQSHPQFKT